jgi:hypothetical protein
MLVGDFRHGHHYARNGAPLSPRLSDNTGKCCWLGPRAPFGKRVTLGRLRGN